MYAKAYENTYLAYFILRQINAFRILQPLLPMADFVVMLFYNSCNDILFCLLPLYPNQFCTLHVVLMQDLQVNP